jgi:YVTN family beta-propeller protein
VIVARSPAGAVSRGPRVASLVVAALVLLVVQVAVWVPAPATASATTSATAYVANYSDNTVTPIDVATNTAGTAIPVGGGANGIAITPDGATAYVAARDGLVTPITVATNTPCTPISVGGSPVGIAITPDVLGGRRGHRRGATAYVTNISNNTVTPIAVGTNTPPALPSRSAASRSGSRSPRCQSPGIVEDSVMRLEPPGLEPLIVRSR